MVHPNGFATVVVGSNNNNSNNDTITKVDNNKLFTPFVQDYRIVPTALQFWNKNISNSTNITEDNIDENKEMNGISNNNNEKKIIDDDNNNGASH